MDVQTMSVRLPVDLYERLRREAFERRVPMNAIIVEGVELRLAPNLKAMTEMAQGRWWREARMVRPEDGDQP